MNVAGAAVNPADLMAAHAKVWNVSVHIVQYGVAEVVIPGAFAVIF